MGVEDRSLASKCGPTTLRNMSCTGVDKEIRKSGDKMIRKDFLSRASRNPERGVLHRGGSIHLGRESCTGVDQVIFC